MSFRRKPESRKLVEKSVAQIYGENTAKGSLVSIRKRDSFVEVKAGDNFNHRNTLTYFED
ncbi:MAG: hypothetical protein COX16_02660 [Deltaproteobacteria bacterium CG23_combo_of_CG06-09_8_20_14_all_51_20]|nr:MAG: hypothetical protein COX16_02660 [Deltaproteobacteria bacterium CG23_combo_of_CG06-09_8_20_14_all_51_20]